MLRAWIYGRASGEEKDTGQDVRAQVEQVAAEVRARGFEVAGSCFDDGVSGDVHPSERRGFNAAWLAIGQGKADFLAIRDVSRFSRCFPTTAYDAFAEYERRGLKVLCVREPEFTTLYDAEIFDPEDNPSRVLVRFIPLWKSWADLAGIRTSTAEVMAEILAGRRSTKSGLPPGRPSKEIPAEALKIAQTAIAAGEPFAEALRLVNVHLVAGAKDPATIAKRKVGKGTLARALGLWPSAQNANPPKTPAGLVGGPSDGNGPDLGGA